jgi:hypothetical protein
MTVRDKLLKDERWVDVQELLAFGLRCVVEGNDSTRLFEHK